MTSVLECGIFHNESQGHDERMIPHDLSRLSILAVDDSRLMLRLLETFLRGMGVLSITCQPDPVAAQGDVERLLPHIAIVDLLMRPMDGVALIRTIRGLPRPACFTHILALSGFTDKIHVLEAADAGAHQVLAKPISAVTLHRRIIGLVNDERPFVRTPSYFGPERRSAGRMMKAQDRRSPKSEIEIIEL